MQSSPQKSRRGFVTYIIVALIVAATAAFGLQNVFQLSSPTYLAKVGAETIGPNALAREMDIALSNERQEGRNITPQQAAESGMPQQLLDSLVIRTALHSYAAAHGVSASDAAVAKSIREIPAVQSPITGRFDREAFNEFLRSNGYGQNEFEAEMRAEMSAALMRQANVVGVRAPTSFGALALAFESEVRTVTVLEVPARLVGAIPAPEGAAIEAIYEELTPRLKVPEYRALTLVVASPAEFAARIVVPEDRIRQEFEQRRAGLTQPEKRSFVLISAQTQEQARAAAARLDAGEDPQAIAASLGLQVVRYDAKPAPEVADSAVRAAVFGMARGAPASALRGAVTPWAAVKLTDIIAPVSVTYESVREQVRDELARVDAADALNDAVSAFEDARSAGSAVADAARAARLSVIEIPAVDSQGRDDKGAPVSYFEGQDDLLASAFETVEGESSDFMPGPDGADVAVAVAAVTPERTRTLDEVRPAVIEAYYARERTRRFNEIGDELRASWRNKDDYRALARARGLGVVAQSQPINRQAASRLPARALAGKIFSGAEGDVVSDLRADGGSLFVARIEAVTRADPAQSGPQIQAFRLQLSQVLARAVDEAVIAQVRNDAGVKLAADRLARLYPTGRDEDAEQ